MEAAGKSNVKLNECLTVKHKVHIIRGMNKLPRDKRVQIITLLVEGMSLRAVTRATGCSINTVTKLLITAGMACAEYQDTHLRNLRARRIQIDEIWCFNYCKDANKKTAKAAPTDAGSLWTWVALDADTKLVPSWLVGERGAPEAYRFVRDLADRLATRVQITTDGHRPYLSAVPNTFNHEVDFAMLVKHYGVAPGAVGAERRYSPGECIKVEKTGVEGAPDWNHVSTSFVERQNLTMRMAIRRYTRLTNAFSKKAENHAWATALHFMNYNFCRIHKTLRCTPAMAAKVTTKLWDITDLVRMIEAWEARQSAAV